MSALAVTSASQITLNHFIVSKHVVEILTEHFDVWPFATLKGSIDPHCVSSLNACCNFMSTGCMFELARVVVKFEGLLPRNQKVCAIICHFASFALVILEWPLPFCLLMMRTCQMLNEDSLLGLLKQLVIVWRNVSGETINGSRG